MTIRYIYLLLATLFCSCQYNTVETALHPISPPYIPKDGTCLVFVGQELEAIGGLDTYANGYLDHFRQPAGFTMYTDLMPGTESFGFIHQGLDGLTTTDDWGDSPSNMSEQLSDSSFAGMALAIGLDMKGGHDTLVAKGDHDDLIFKLADWIKKTAPRPIFLRIGYEFDGHDWNHYQAEAYVSSFKRIRHIMEQSGVANITYVWQSKGRGTTLEDMNRYYPGDDYVDWCGYSFFAPDNENHPMLAFARQHNKPVFLAEATPILVDSTGRVTPIDFDNEQEAALAWEAWFVPFFRTIDQNPDIVKAFSYINCHWKAHPMWVDNPYFQHIDARLQNDSTLSVNWRNELSKPAFILGPLY